VQTQRSSNSRYRPHMHQETSRRRRRIAPTRISTRAQDASEKESLPRGMPPRAVPARAKEMEVGLAFPCWHYGLTRRPEKCATVPGPIQSAIPPDKSPCFRSLTTRYTGDSGGAQASGPTSEAGDYRTIQPNRAGLWPLGRPFLLVQI
jgi:hypothetical protein